MNEIPHLYEALSFVVREARRERKMPQRELAERMGCARSFVAAIEGRKWQPSINAFLCMANALEMEPEDLLKRLKATLLVLGNRQETRLVQEMREATPDQASEQKNEILPRAPRRKGRPF